MRFSRKTIELVMLMALIMVGLGYVLEQYPNINTQLQGHKLIHFGGLIFFGFSIDYLFREGGFFKSKYYRILVFGIGMLILAALMSFLDIKGSGYLMLAAVIMLPISYVAWVVDHPHVKLSNIVKAIYCLLIATNVFVRFFHIGYYNLLLNLAFLFALIAIGFQRFEYRNKKRRTVS